MPYLLNAWYVAAYSEEVTREPLARTLLDIPVVFYRTETGEPVALLDRCPHRFAPLSLGKLDGDDLVCGYHGLRFGRAGSCTHNPHSPDSIPKNARVTAFPVAERFGHVWFWPGDPARADIAQLPAEFGFLDEPEKYRNVKGYLHVKAHYQLIVDNLLDLSHAPFLHPHFAVKGMTPEEQLRAVTAKLVRESNRITAYRLRSGVPPNRPTVDIFGFSQDPVDSRSHMTWYPPALLYLDIGTCVAGTPESEGLCMPAAHFITPETERTSHYFFSQTRNMRIHDPEVDIQLAKVFDTAFRLQDEPMIEAVQSRMGAATDIFALNPVLLSADAPPVSARRLLDRLIAEEHGQAPASAAE
jgi:vanillate O-demethylase monooxygenase subunit